MKYENYDEKNTTLANFFLIGAPKAGTTSIDRFLRDRTDVYLSPIKEPCYFCDDIKHHIKLDFKKQSLINLDTYFRRKKKPIIHNHVIEQKRHYDMLFDDSNEEIIIGECTPHYLASSVAAKRIYEYNPNARIVAVIRNPIKRIKSHYEMDLRIGKANLSLGRLIKDEIKLANNANGGNSALYIKGSNYKEQLENYIKLFGQDNIHVIEFEKMITKQDNTLRNLINFLDLGIQNEEYFLPKENEGGGIPKFIYLNKIMYDLGIQKMVRRTAMTLPKRYKKAIRDKIYSRSEVDFDDEKWINLPEIQSLSENYDDLCKQLAAGKFNF